MSAATLDGLVLGVDADLSSSVRELVRRVRETGRGVVLGDDSGEVAVVLSVSAFERLQAAASQAGLQHAVDEAEVEAAEGRFIENDEMMEKLRRWADE
jgi:prevent-host-death family protein